jgi:alanine racemase
VSADVASLRPTRAEVDLDALVGNLEIVRGRAGRRPVLAVVKADAYGHGAVAIARTLASAGTESFGVALPEEGVELRRAGVAAPIVLLGGFAPPQAHLVVAHRLTSAVYRADQIAALDAAARERGVTVPIHLKIDSGMGRLGVPSDDASAFAELLGRAPGLVVEGCFSHLAVADEPADPFTARQIERFQGAVAAVRERGFEPRQVHLANSAAVLSHPPSWLTTVRPGIMLYGYPPSTHVAEASLKPVLTLKAGIIYIKDVAPGASLGYGRTFIASRPVRVASLAAGYDDGLPRRLGNTGYVLIDGRRAPVVGRVSMDLTTVDVTDIPSAAVGGEAVVIGVSGDERLGADRLASWCGTIPWEILCGVGARVPRLYTREGHRWMASRFDSTLP